MADIFRKAALERLSSPEQLDKAITVSKPVSWIALLGLTVVVAAVVVWAVFGSLPDAVAAQGIAVRSGNEAETQMIECFVPFACAGRIAPGMRAVVQSISDDQRFDAEVVGVSFADAGISDMELSSAPPKSPPPFPCGSSLAYCPKGRWSPQGSS